MVNDKHIVVLMGGWSSERDISLISGAECVHALRVVGYRVSGIDYSSRSLHDLDHLKPDIVFNALHGVGGEDGVIQAILELLKIPYTHSGVLASALAMDKVKAKKIFSVAGLSVAKDILIHSHELTAHLMEPPYVIKKINQGSSIGVYFIPEKQTALPDELETFDGYLMIEEYISGQEFTCAIIDNKPSTVVKIQLKKELYDYQSKYESDGTYHVIPAPISRQLQIEIQRQTLLAHQSLGCRGITRSDFRLDDKKGGRGLVILETNTQPGMTSSSILPEIAAYDGMSYMDLVRWMVEDASCQR